MHLLKLTRDYLKETHSHLQMSLDPRRVMGRQGREPLVALEFTIDLGVELSRSLARYP
jgi:hypothetical protein